MLRAGNRNCFSKTIFDFRLMGINFFVPIIAMILLIIYLYMICYSAGMTPSFYFTYSECVVPLFGAWWAMHLMRPIVEDSGNEIYYSYNISKIYLGLLRVIRCWLIYCVIIFLYCSVLRLMTEYDLLSYFVQLAAQTLFYFSFGFFAMSVSRKALFSWVLNLAYALFYLYTRNQFAPELSIYTLAEEPVDLNILLPLFITRILIMSCVMLLIGQILFSFRGFDGRFIKRFK